MRKTSINVLGVVIVIIAIVVLYYRTLSYEYVLDDKIVLTENKFVQEGISGIPKILSNETFAGYLENDQNLVEGGRYRPLSLVTFALEYELFGMNKSVSHGINILLYIILILLIWSFVSKLDFGFRKSIASYFVIGVVCIFAFHPIQTEVVANVKGRDELMGLIGGISAMIFAFNYIRSRNSLHLIWTSIAFLFGIFSKENIITFLAIIPITIYLFEKFTRKEFLRLFSTLFASVLLYLIIRYQVMGYFIGSGVELDRIMNNPFYGLSDHEKYGTILFTLLLYLKLFFFPIELTHDYYPYHIPIQDFSDPWVLFSILLYLVLGGLSIYGLVKKRKVFYGLIFYLVALSIVSNIVINIGTFMNERFLFVPSLGLAIFIVYVITKYLIDKSSIKRIIGLSVLGVVIVLFFARGYVRIPAWKNNMTLNMSGVEVSENSARANTFMAVTYYEMATAANDNMEKHRYYELAYPYAFRAVEIIPNYKDGNLMLAGCTAGLFNEDKDMDRLLEDFAIICKNRPDIGYVKQYLDFLLKNNDDLNERITRFYYEIGQGYYIKKKADYNLGKTFLTYALEAMPNSYEVNEALASCYDVLGDNQRAKYHRDLIGLYKQKIQENK